MDLALDPDELAACVSCGLCLPHCPTYRVTGDDVASPRGRIALMRAVQDGGAPVTEDVVAAMETCVQCRGCEPACPSGVPFGHLMEGTRSVLADEGRITPRWQRVALALLARRRLLLTGSSLLAVAQRFGVVPSRRLGLPRRLPVRRRPHAASGADVWLFTGCVMDAWQRDTHHAVQRVLEVAGFGVRPTADLAPCCGALHVHAGLTAAAQRLATRTIADLADPAPILVDSAGCGAALKDYGRLGATPGAEAFAARVHDVNEWLAAHADRLPETPPLDLTVAVQDPCHLRHVQGVHQSVRAVLAPRVRRVVELDDEGLCCGAGGAFALVQPELAAQVRQRKLAAIERSGATVVASANPGCALHLAAAGIDVRHPLELVAESLALSPSRSATSGGPDRGRPSPSRSTGRPRPR